MRDSFKHNILCGLLVTLLMGVIACDPSTGGSVKPSETPVQRIISLTPSLTRMLQDMGKGDQLVGVSQEDDASLGLPVCGSYNNPVVARIVELSPDIVLTESPMGRVEEVPPLLRSLAQEGLFELRVIPHSRSLGDVERALLDREVGLGAAVGDIESAERAAKLMSLRIKLVNSVVQDASPPRVLMLINPTTLGAIGTGVTHDELLRLAGGSNALAHVRTGYLTLDRAQLQQTIRPDMVLILEPGGSELVDGDVRLRALEGLSIPAVMNRRFAVIDHPHAMLPSTALPEVLVEMAVVLHPDRAKAIREAYDAAATIMQRTEAQEKPGGQPEPGAGS